MSAKNRSFILTSDHIRNGSAIIAGAEVMFDAVGLSLPVSPEVYSGVIGVPGFTGVASEDEPVVHLQAASDVSASDRTLLVEYSEMHDKLTATQAENAALKAEIEQLKAAQPVAVATSDPDEKVNGDEGDKTAAKKAKPS